LVNEVLDDADTLHARVKERANALLAKPARALKETKALLHGTIDPRDQLKRESAVFGELLTDPDTQARIEAMTKR
jgi:enoyl-CoA hydratase/carnithine racemase